MALTTRTYSPIAGGHGRLYKADGGSWDANRTGTAAEAEDTLGYVSARAGGGNWEIARFFAPFTTSNIPDQATIVSAFVRLIANGGTFTNTDTDTLRIVENAQASASALELADFDQLNTNVIGSIAFASWNNTNLAANDISITDLTKISKTGNTMLGFRSARDLTDADATGDNIINWTSSTMILSVTYRTADGLLGGEI